jgi:hypothetical protein
MTFKEKIDKILDTKELHINSVTALEDKVQAGRGAINEFYKEDRNPGRKTLKRIKSLPGLNLDWWETGVGTVLKTDSSENTTPVQKGGDIKEIIEVLRSSLKDKQKIIDLKEKELRDCQKENERLEAELKKNTPTAKSKP